MLACSLNTKNKVVLIADGTSNGARRQGGPPPPPPTPQYWEAEEDAFMDLQGTKEQARSRMNMEASINDGNVSIY